LYERVFAGGSSTHVTYLVTRIFISQKIAWRFSLMAVSGMGAPDMGTSRQLIQNIGERKFELTEAETVARKTISVG
jgi:hypothetical protein